MARTRAAETRKRRMETILDTDFINRALAEYDWAIKHNKLFLASIILKYKLKGVKGQLRLL